MFASPSVDCAFKEALIVHKGRGCEMQLRPPKLGLVHAGIRLPQKIRESILKGIGKRTTPLNAFPLLFTAEHALIKLANSIESWSDIVRDMIFAGAKASMKFCARNRSSVSPVMNGWGLWRVMMFASRAARGLSGLAI